MAENNKTTSTGFGIGTILFLIFLTLKLGEWGVVAKWSWWWVTAPLWLPALAVVITLFIVGIIAVITNSINNK